MSFRDPFAFFGLKRETADEASLKKAYAARLKTTRPDEDREGFMELREAFEAARTSLRYDLWEAENAEEDEDEFPDEAFAAPNRMVGAESSAPDHQTTSAESRSREITVPPQVLVFDEIISLLGSEESALRRNELAALLADPAVEDIDTYTWLSARVRQHICELTGLFDGDKDSPRWRSWAAGACLFDLENHFGWERQQTRDPWQQAQNIWISRLSARIRQHLANPDGEGAMVRRRRRRGGGYRYYTVVEGHADRAPDVRPVRRQKLGGSESQMRVPIGLIIFGGMLLVQLMRFIAGS